VIRKLIYIGKRLFVAPVILAKALLGNLTGLRGRSTHADPVKDGARTLPI
jgi:hypothetical protein